MIANKSISRIISCFLTIVLLLASAPFQTVQAAFHTVSTCGDTGPGSLRQTIVEASDGDTVNFNLDCPASGPITLASQVDIDKNLTISGEGHNIVISGNNATGIFLVQYDMIVTLQYLTLKNGALIDGSDGGAIYDNGGFLTLNHITFEDNHTSGSNSDGGAIFHGSNGSLTILNCIFSGNSAERYGGAIYSWVDSTITDSAFTNNSAYRGGAFMSYSGNIATFNRVTMSGNTAIGPGNTFGHGAAIYFGFGTLNINNSTLSGNGSIDTTNAGGALYVYNSTLNLWNSTIVNNLINTVDPGFAGGGLQISNSTLNYYNTILANNTKDDCYSDAGLTVANNINNLVEVSVGCGTPAITLDPNLGALADNGGFTLTHALLAGSPAIDAGDDATCLATDQRLISRPQGPKCDIGAFEKAVYLIFLPLTMKP